MVPAIGTIGGSLPTYRTASKGYSVLLPFVPNVEAWFDRTREKHPNDAKRGRRFGSKG